MLAILQFIFSGFWTFLGTLILLSVVCNAGVRIAYVVARYARRTP